MDGVLYFDDQNLYKDNLLKLDIPVQLKDAINNLAFLRMNELRFAKLPELFNLKTLKDIHKYIFKDVFSWAGEENEAAMNNVIKIIELNNNLQWIYMNMEEKVNNVSSMIYDLLKENIFRVGSFQAVMTYVGMFTKAHGFAMDLTVTNVKAVDIANCISLEYTDSREATVAIVKEAMIVALVKENTYAKVISNIEKAGFAPTDYLVETIKKLNHEMCKIHTVIEIYDLFKNPDKLTDICIHYVSEISHGFISQEKTFSRPSYSYKNPEYNNEK